MPLKIHNGGCSALPDQANRLNNSPLAHTLHSLCRQVLEADRILGAEKFKLYLHSASPEVLAIIRHYVTSGVMEAVEWHLPFTDVSLVHYFGQMAAINDCLYSYQYTSRYVVFHDFDEVLFPRAHDTWNLMLEAVRRQVGSRFVWEISLPGRLCAVCILYFLLTLCDQREKIR